MGNLIFYAGMRTKKITVLYGTDTINKFDTALVLQGDASIANLNIAQS